MSEISIEIDGVTYEGWDNLNVNRNINSICGDFQFTMADFVFDDMEPIIAGQNVVVKISAGVAGILETKLITGYIDRVSRRKAGNSTELSFSGRDKTSDLVDCSAIHKSNTWKRKGVLEIAQDICSPFGIDVEWDTDATGQVVDDFTIQNGETSFAAIERLCRAFGILPTTDPDGKLLLTAIGEEKADQRLEVGKNIKELLTEEDYSGRYSQYICRGQPRGNGSTWTKDNIQLLGEAIDAGIDRYRPLVLIAEKKMTATEIAKRAAWEAQVRAGRAIKSDVTVRGWYQDPENEEGSRPWEIGEIVELIDESWKINAELVISSVSFSLAEGAGRITTLELSPPEIFKADPGETIELARKSSVRPQ